MKLKKGLFIALGCCNVALGTIGMFVPVLPTTIFLLAAAWFFGRSSPRFLFWLEHNRLFGRYLSNYRSGRGMEVRDKVGTLVVLWLGLGISVVLVAPLWLRLLLVAIGLGVTIHILMIKTAAKKTVLSQEA